MGAELVRSGETRVAGSHLKLSGSKTDASKLILELPFDLLERIVSNKDALLLMDMVSEVLSSQHRPKDRDTEAYRRSTTPERVPDLSREELLVADKLSHSFPVSIMTSTFWRSLILCARPQQKPIQQQPRESTTLEASKSRERPQDSTISASKQFKRVNFQTYEYLSKDYMRGTSQDDSCCSSGSLGEDTEENVKNMKLDWNAKRHDQNMKNVGVNLKHLVTQNGASASINIASVQKKQQNPISKHPDMIKEKENYYPPEAPLVSRKPEEKISPRFISSQTVQPTFQPRSYVQIHQAKRGQPLPRISEEAENQDKRPQEQYKQVEIRNIRGLPNTQNRASQDPDLKMPHFGVQSKNAGFGPSPPARVEKRLTYTGAE